jgi:hypothetical protein
VLFARSMRARDGDKREDLNSFLLPASCLSELPGAGLADRKIGHWRGRCGILNDCKEERVRVRDQQAVGLAVADL